MRRAQILDVAKRDFVRRGYHVANVADICKEAQIGRGTLYQYFGNKRAVMLALTPAHFILSRGARDFICVLPFVLAWLWCVLTLEDEGTHADHFWVRDAASGGERPVNKYLDRLDDIRRLQDYVVERARDYGVPVFENSNKTETVGAVIELVLASAAELETV